MLNIDELENLLKDIKVYANNLVSNDDKNSYLDTYYQKNVFTSKRYYINLIIMYFHIIVDDFFGSKSVKEKEEFNFRLVEESRCKKCFNEVETKKQM